MLTYALRSTGLSRQTYEKWMRSNPSFRKAVSAVLDVKKDFAEKRLLALVERGEIAPTIFVNRTLNKDRGYAESLAGGGASGESLSLAALKTEIGAAALFNAFQDILKDDDKVKAAIARLRSLKDLSVRLASSGGRPPAPTPVESDEDEEIEEAEYATR